MIAQLPKTGVTTSYFTGDDGYFQAGSPLARFVDRGDGTVLCPLFDPPLMFVKSVNLMIPGAAGEASGAIHPSNQVQRPRGDWHVTTDYLPGDSVWDASGNVWVCIQGHNSGGADISNALGSQPLLWRSSPLASSADVTAATDTSAHFNWSLAIAACLGGRFGGSLYYAGYDDWRLPNIFEISLLLSMGIVAPMLPALPQLPSDQYWSSTPLTVSGNPVNARLVSFITGTITTAAVSSGHACLPVRGGRNIRGGMRTR